MSRDVLLAVLSDVAARAAELVRLLDTAADASKAPAAERAALADAMTGVVQADLEVAQEAVFAAHGVRKADVEASYEWHAASGPGRDRKVVDAASAIRKMVGRHLLTRGKTLSVLREMFEHSITQSDAIADAVAAAAQSGGDVMRVMSTAPMGVANSYLQSRMGMTLQELLARAQVLSAGGVEDAGAQAFMREVRVCSGGNSEYRRMCFGCTRAFARL